MWADPESYWGYIMGDAVMFQHINHRVWQCVVVKIAQKQTEALKAQQDEELARPPPPIPGAVDNAAGRRDLEFATAVGGRGLPLKMLLTGRRALERGMAGPKTRCFEDWPNDTEWVRIEVGCWTRRAGVCVC